MNAEFHDRMIRLHLVLEEVCYCFKSLVCGFWLAFVGLLLDHQTLPTISESSDYVKCNTAALPD